MADVPKAAELIGKYRTDLLEQGLREGELLDAIVRDMAARLHDGSLAIPRDRFNV